MGTIVIEIIINVQMLFFELDQNELQTNTNLPQSCNNCPDIPGRKISQHVKFAINYV
jgi:hypothetical protein